MLSRRITIGFATTLIGLVIPVISVLIPGAHFYENALFYFAVGILPYASIVASAYFFCREMGEGVLLGSALNSAAASSLSGLIAASTSRYRGGSGDATTYVIFFLASATFVSSLILGSLGVNRRNSVTAGQVIARESRESARSFQKNIIVGIVFALAGPAILAWLPSDAMWLICYTSCNFYLPAYGSPFLVALLIISSASGYFFSKALERKYMVESSIAVTIAVTVVFSTLFGWTNGTVGIGAACIMFVFSWFFQLFGAPLR